MNCITNLLMKAFCCIFNIGPIALTILTMFFLVVPYNSTGNFDLGITLLTFITIISAALLVLFLHQLMNGKKDYRLLCNMSFLSMVLSIVNIMLSKTSFPFSPMLNITILETLISVWPIFAILLTANIFLFYAMFRETFNHLKAD